MILLLEPLNGEMDTSSLAAHGEVRYIFDNTGKSVLRTEDFMHEVAYRAQKMDFDPQHDHFVIAGRATKVALALSSLMKQHGHVKVLIYDGGSGQYVTRRL